MFSFLKDLKFLGRVKKAEKINKPYRLPAGLIGMFLKSLIVKKIESNFAVKVVDINRDWLSGMKHGKSSRE